jgi:hypothetical protein
MKSFFASIIFKRQNGEENAIKIYADCLKYRLVISTSFPAFSTVSYKAC